ncbi:MAG: hypothetical protein KJP23_08240 [Deltaproteobacteria bacterium]|nr:hypothetical protein [Deltaproteobacteria bacterium]
MSYRSLDPMMPTGILDAARVISRAMEGKYILAAPWPSHHDRDEMQTKKLTTLFIGGLVISLLSPFITNGHFASQLVLFTLIFVLAALVALWAFSSYRIEKTTKSNQKIRPSRVLLGLAIILGIQIAAFPVIIKLEKHRVEKAKNFCEKHIPALRQYHAVRGQFPGALSLFQVQELKPGFLKGQKIYKKTDNGFIFKFRSPGPSAGGYVYYSEKDYWVRHDSWMPED